MRKIDNGKAGEEEDLFAFRFFYWFFYFSSYSVGRRVSGKNFIAFAFKEHGNGKE